MTDRFALLGRCAGATVLVAGLLTAAASTASAATTANSSCVLPTSFGYTEFTTGAANESSGDSDGPTAFGGTATLSNFAMSEDTPLLGASNIGFVVGGAATGGGTSSIHLGNGYYDVSLSGISAHAGTIFAVSPANLPVNFAAAGAQDSAFSAELAALSTSAGDLAGTSSSTLTLTATQTESNNIYVWDLSVGQLTGISSIKVIGVPAGGVVIVNVPDSGSLTADITNYLDGVSSNSSPGPALDTTTIFNFPAATTLNLSGSALSGSFLAPSANTTFNSGRLDGSIMSATLTGTSESTYGPLLSPFCVPGPTSSLPEGHPIEMVGVGFVIFGGYAAFRYRRRVLQHR